MRESDRSVRPKHSTNPSRYLYVEMLPNYSVTLQARRRKSGRAQFQKILAPSDQVHQLLDIVARDIYYRHFNDACDYLGNKRRLTSSVTEMKRGHRPIFDFLHERSHELKVMLTLSEHAWEATHEEIEGENDREAIRSSLCPLQRDSSVQREESRKISARRSRNASTIIWSGHAVLNVELPPSQLLRKGARSKVRFVHEVLDVVNKRPHALGPTFG